MKVYGYVSMDGFIEVGATVRGAQRQATKAGYATVGYRNSKSRAFHATHKKIEGVWCEVSNEGVPVSKRVYGCLVDSGFLQLGTDLLTAKRYASKINQSVIGYCCAVTKAFQPLHFKIHGRWYTADKEKHNE